MPETVFQPTSMSLDLWTLPGTPFCHPSAVSSPFSLSFGSTAFSPCSMSLWRFEGLVDWPVNISSSCRLMGTVKGFWSKGYDLIRYGGSVSLSRSKCLGLIK